MGHFSNLDTALSEKQHGRGREALRVGAIGVCLDDSGLPVVLYRVDTIYACGSLDVFAVEEGHAYHETPRKIESGDFWALT